MNPFNYIRSWFVWATNQLIYLALDCYGSALLPNFLGDAFNALSDWTAAIATYSLDLANWYNTVTAKITQILPWATIQSYITNWLRYISDLSTIFYYFWSNVTSVITSWWSSTQYTVQGWISTAQSYLQGQITNLSTYFYYLQSAWDAFKGKIPSIDAIISWWSNWWGNTMANLDSWWDDRLLDISALIDSAFLSREPFWAGWLDWKDAVIEFVQDPWQWLYDRVEDLFDRFW